MIDYKAFFKQHRIFRLDEFKAYAQKHNPQILESSYKKMLSYYCKTQLLKRIQKGLYLVTDGFSTDDISPLLVAGKASADSVLAYHSALESHQIAYTYFNRHTFLSSRSAFEFEFRDQHYCSVQDPLLNQLPEKSGLGIETIATEGIHIQRTNLARTIVDALDRFHLSGGWEEVWRSLDNIISFDAEFAVEYALTIGRQSLVAKLGYFMDQRPEHLAIDTSIIKQLLPHKPKQMYYLDRNLTKEKRVHIKKWSLVVPRYLHSREWEEPNYDADI
jgi:predicted transcriptional regulator of viral defense system